MIERNETEARQGRSGKTVFTILNISVALAALALFGFFIMTMVASREAAVEAPPPSTESTSI